MLLMGIKEYAVSRSLSDKLIRKLVADGVVSFNRSGRKYLLGPDVVDEQIKKFFSPQPEPEPQEPKAPKIKVGSFHAALKALRA